MRRLNLDQLRTFLAVAKTGNFSEAGRQLNLTQSAVSQQIKELESHLGIRVLDRLGKRAHPTAAGEELREHAGRLLQQSDHLMEAMRIRRDGGWGRVRLLASATLAAYVLPPLLLALRKRHPRLEVSVAAGTVRQVLRSVVDNEADLAFVNAPAPLVDPALAIDVACESSFMAFWPRAFGPAPQVVRPEHLTDKPFIFYTPGNLSYELVQTWFQRSGCQPATSMESWSGLSIVPLVDAGLGVSILPREVATATTVLNNVIVRPIDPGIPTRLCVAIHKDKPRHKALRVVHAALLATRLDERKPPKRSKRWK
jgi:DNA-binding transcriptional LysR family regulator